jgi:hypothetical protein
MTSQTISTVLLLTLNQGGAAFRGGGLGSGLGDGRGEARDDRNGGGGKAGAGQPCQHAAPLLTKLLLLLLLLLVDGGKRTGQLRLFMRVRRGRCGSGVAGGRRARRRA